MGGSYMEYKVIVLLRIYLILIHEAIVGRKFDHVHKCMFQFDHEEYLIHVKNLKSEAKL